MVQELREIRLVQEDDSEPVQDQSINLEFVQGSITFATDRRDYNPTSQIAFRYDWDDGRSEPSERFFAFLRIELVTANGQTATLTHTDEKLLFTESLLKDSDSLEAERTIKNEEGEIIKYPFGKLKPANLYQFSIGDLIHTGDADRREFDTLGSKLKFTLVQYVRISDNKEKKVELIHTVDLVEAPVIPVPEAGYALLRSENDEPSVSCRRFAWSPNASRIELICDQDLRQEIVRRRAIFRWNDTIRRGVSPRYAIQKYTVTGSTHFPDIIDFELN